MIRMKTKERGEVDASDNCAHIQFVCVCVHACRVVSTQSLVPFLLEMLWPNMMGTFQIFAMLVQTVSFIPHGTARQTNH